jgi:hypothetical protein
MICVGLAVRVWRSVEAVFVAVETTDLRGRRFERL